MKNYLLLFFTFLPSFAFSNISCTLINENSNDGTKGIYFDSSRLFGRRGTLTDSGKEKLSRAIDEILFLSEKGVVDINSLTLNIYTGFLGTKAYNKRKSIEKADVIREYIKSKINKDFNINAYGSHEKNPRDNYFLNKAEEEFYYNNTVIFTINGLGDNISLPKCGEVINIEKSFTLSSDLLFKSKSDILTKEGDYSLQQIIKELQNISPTSINSISINGYTDRIEMPKDSDAVMLSQRRARAVSKYFASLGYDHNVVDIGYGKANPVTANMCDLVKTDKALIACLAPDRRVEIFVKATVVAE